MPNDKIDYTKVVTALIADSIKSLVTDLQAIIILCKEAETEASPARTAAYHHHLGRMYADMTSLSNLGEISNEGYHERKMELRTLGNILIPNSFPEETPKPTVEAHNTIN